MEQQETACKVKIGRDVLGRVKEIEFSGLDCEKLDLERVVDRALTKRDLPKNFSLTNIR